MLKNILVTIGVLGLMIGNCIGQGVPTNTTVEIIKRGSFRPYNDLADDVNEIWNKTNRNFILLDTTMQSLDDRVVILEATNTDISSNIIIDDITQITNRSHSDLTDIGTLTHPEIESRITGISDSVKTNITEIETNLSETEVNTSTITGLSATTSEQSSEISEIVNNVAGVVGWTLSSNSSLDTMIFINGDNILKIPVPDTEETDVTPPTVLSAEVGNVEDSLLYLTMSEPVTSAYLFVYLVETSTYVWTITENGTNFGVDDIEILTGDTVVVLTLDSTILSGSNITVSYTRPGAADDLADMSGNYLVSFSDKDVINNVTTEVVAPIAAYHFENSTVDSSGNGNTLTSYSASYEALYNVEGSYGGSVDGFDTYFAVPALDVGYQSTYSFWYTAFLGASPTGTRTMFSTLDGNDGIQIDYYCDDNQIIVTTGNGTTTTTAYSTTDLSWVGSGTFHHFVVVTGLGACNIYFDSVDVTDVATLATDYDNNAPGRIGIDFDDANEVFGYFDAFFVYATNADADDVSNLYNSPGTRIEIGNSTDPPVDDSDIITYWTNDWSDYAIQTTLPEDTLFAHMPNFIAANSSGENDIYDYVDIVDFEGERWAKNWYYQNHCCTEQEYESDYNNGGTGMDAKAWITDENTLYTELYLTYDIYLDATTGDFENSDGFKQPGLEPYWVSGYGSGRTMILGTSYDDLAPAYYNKAFWDGFDGERSVQTNTKTGGWITSGTKINITLRMVFGSSGSWNGMTELFVDGIFIGGGGYDPWPGDGRYSIPWYQSSMTRGGWGNVVLSTFMGGDRESYQSPKDQWELLGMIKVWMYSDDVVDIPRWDDDSPRSESGRNITGALSTLGYDF